MSAARDLIVTLDNERRQRSNFDVPIAFLAHGTGGLIVKQVRCGLINYSRHWLTHRGPDTPKLVSRKV